MGINDRAYLVELWTMHYTTLNVFVDIDTVFSKITPGGQPSEPTSFVRVMMEMTHVDGLQKKDPLLNSS